MYHYLDIILSDHHSLIALRLRRFYKPVLKPITIHGDNK